MKGDRLTDERIQAAQCSMINGEKAIDRFEGFISKIEDFHRLINFLEVITCISYNVIPVYIVIYISYSGRFCLKCTY